MLRRAVASSANLAYPECKVHAYRDALSTGLHESRTKRETGHEVIQRDGHLRLYESACYFSRSVILPYAHPLGSAWGVQAQYALRPRHCKLLHPVRDPTIRGICACAEARSAVCSLPSFDAQVASAAGLYRVPQGRENIPGRRIVSPVFSVGCLATTPI